jgi:general secretion pathway protein G
VSKENKKSFVYKTKLKTDRHTERKGTKMRKNKGFTLVEILIVVVILGILAAIVIPQFSDASTESKLSSCRSSLQSLRSQIQLFMIQHQDTPPALATFAADMTTETEVDAAATAGDSSGNEVGPYIMQVPFNPWNESQTVAAADAVGVGWVYNETTGDIYVGKADATAAVQAELVASGDAL